YRINDIYLLGCKTPLPVEDLPRSAQDAKQHLLRMDQLASQIQRSRAEMVIVAPDEQTRLDLAALMEALQDNKELAFVPPMSGMSMYGMDVQHFFGSHTVLLKPKQRVDKGLNRIMKRGLDIVGSVCGLIALSGPIAIVALLISKDGGPAFYYQERIGKSGKPFKCWKLRSMVVNSQEVLEELLAKDEQARKEWETDFKLKNDPRITRIGHIIRKTSIDELPQLWNVLKGEMSLVGPRPIVAQELEYYGKHSIDYLAAKPGLTGLWQVSGRNDTSYAYRVYLDTWYVSHWSLWTDIVIIIQTVVILINRKGAY
ncbi:MAG: exopolysaccharide biosynthesis polyprenyl glycosylphosphotransferase, partial [Alphaproteobacteria bacterium]